jgi:hypothetical protein
MTMTNTVMITMAMAAATIIATTTTITSSDDAESDDDNNYNHYIFHNGYVVRILPTNNSSPSSTLWIRFDDIPSNSSRQWDFNSSIVES